MAKVKIVIECEDADVASKVARQLVEAYTEQAERVAMDEQHYKFTTNAKGDREMVFPLEYLVPTATIEE
jgi:hypothetical protein